MQLSTGDLKQIPIYGQAPPPMSHASLAADPYTQKVYIFGGFDGNAHHNWIWEIDPIQHSARIAVEDCNWGTCPYASTSSMLLTNDSNNRKLVVTGEAPDVPAEQASQWYFVHRSSGWEQGTDRELWIGKGDCDGDWQPDPYAGTRGPIPEL